MLRDYLADHRIRSEVFRAGLSSGAGELPANIYPEVWLYDERDTDLARGYLREFLRPAGEPAAWICPNCGEQLGAGFDLCWRCGASREPA